MAQAAVQTSSALRTLWSSSHIRERVLQKDKTVHEITPQGIFVLEHISGTTFRLLDTSQEPHDPDGMVVKQRRQKQSSYRQNAAREYCA